MIDAGKNAQDLMYAKQHIFDYRETSQGNSLNLTVHYSEGANILVVMW